MQFSLAFLAAFLMGSIPTSYLFVKWTRGQDIRELGSGNPGATNVMRVVGKREGLIVLAADILKGFVAVILLSAWVGDHPWTHRTFQFVLGLCSVLGHVFTPFLKFKGGKGVATSMGVALAVYPIPLAVALAVWGAILMIFRYVSVASICAAYAFVVACVFLVH